MTAAAVCGRIVEEVREHIWRQADDITLITAKVM
jgi:hypothetical protein